MAAQEWKKFEKFFEDRTVEGQAEHLIRYIKPDSRIIDVGCGFGSITRDFARRVPRGSVVGIDHNAQAIAIAHAAAREEGLTNIEFIVGDVKDLGKYEDDSFDIAHAHQVMLHLPHPVAALTQMHRIVKPNGGVVGIRDLLHTVMFGTSDLVQENLKQGWQIAKARGAQGGNAGEMHHTWVHQAGFDWEAIEKGVACEEYTKTRLATVVDGQVELARKRGENNDHVERLQRDFNTWLESPEMRAIMVDSWVVGRKA